MKKVRMALVVLVCLLAVGVLISQQASATTYFVWSSGSGTSKYLYSSSPVTYSNMPNQSVVLTYVSSDTNIDFVTGGIIATNFGNDVFINAQPNSGTGRYTISTGISDSTYGAGNYYAYVVTVDMPWSTYTNLYNNPAAIPAGTLYGVSTNTQQLSVWDGFSAAQAVQVGTVLANNTVVVVPEPTSLALLGLGLGLVALRRKFRA